MKIELKNGGTSSSIVDLQNEKVTVNHVTAHSSIDSGRGFQYRNTLDFQNVTPEEMMALAAETILIRARVKFNFRNHENPESLNGMVISVSDLLKNAKTRKGKTVKVNASSIGKMSPAEKAAKLAELADIMNLLSPVVDADTMEIEDTTDEA